LRWRGRGVARDPRRPGRQLDPPRRRRGAEARVAAGRRRRSGPARRFVRTQRDRAGRERLPHHGHPRRLVARPATDGARLGLQPGRRPRARARHGRGIPGCTPARVRLGDRCRARTPREPGMSRGEAIHAGGAPKAVGSYPHARRVGNLLFLSGIGPRTPGTDAISEGIEAQARAVLANVRAVLEASGARWEDLVDVTVFLTDMARDFRAYNAVWA